MKSWLVTFLILTVQIASSQEVITQQKHLLTEKQKRIKDLLEVELTAAKASFDGLNKVEGKAKLILTYERLITLQCFGPFELTLVFPDNITDPECLNYLAELKNLSPDSPLIPCVEKGIKSMECELAFDEQRLGTLEQRGVSKDSIEAVDLEAKLANINNKATLMELQRELEKKILNYKQKNNHENFKEVVSAFNNIIPKACTVIHTKFFEKEPKNTIKAKEQKIKETPDDLKKLILEYADSVDNKGNTNLSAIAYRARYLTLECWKFVNKALNVSRQIAIAHCYREGFYSPACIKAREEERKILNSYKPTSNKPTQGMKPF